MAAFDRLAPRLMRDLIRDLPLDKLDAAAIVGNLAHETDDFRLMQERHPVIAGARGGYGYAQWTGDRRRAFEAWAKSHGLGPASYEANYGYMLCEMRGQERAAVDALKRASGLDAKVVAFEQAYERAGTKAYASRQRRARRALGLFETRERGVNPKPLSKSRTVAGGAATVVAGGGIIADAVTTAQNGVQSASDAWSTGTWVGVALGVLALVAAALVIYARWDDAGRPWPGKRFDGGAV